MARTGKIRRLPPELRDILHRKLDEGCTLDEITAHLRSLGADVSRSGLGRYKQNFDKVSTRLRESREMADAMIQKIGPEATEGRQGRLLVQMLTTLTGDFMFRRLNEADGELDVDEMKSLARALKDTTQAARLSQDFELKIREETRKEAEAKLHAAAKKVEKDVALENLSPMQALARIQAVYRGEA